MLEHLAGIHDAVRVERLLDGAHDLERYRMLIARELCPLELSDAVLRAEAATVSCDEVIHRAVDLPCASHELRGIAAYRNAQIEVQIAVAEMAVRQDARIGHEAVEHGARLLDEARQRTRRNRNVVLDARAL